MKEKKTTVLVPYDFTEVTEFALLHAINYAKKTENEITLLHIVDRKGLLNSYSKKVQETIEATTKLNEIARKHFKESCVWIRPLVLEGSIFTTISDVASFINASLVFMGIHEMKGMQKITGSWAMKVISNTNIPFMIVQAPPVNDTLENIVFPVDESKEIAEKLSWAKYLAKKYESNIRIVKQDYTSGSKVTSLLTFVKDFFSKNKISFDIFETHKSKKFVDSILNYSQKINADAIIIQIKKGINITDYIIGVEEQEVIFNEFKIPVICVNPGNKI